MVASEAHPFAKTGGLAEVVGSLSHALARLGHAVTLVLPRYRGVDTGGAAALSSSIPLGWRTQEVVFHSRPLREGVTVVFVDAPELFGRASLYAEHGKDYPDNDWRFAVFSRAALEYARLGRESPSIIHAHDWQTGLVPVYQKMHFSSDPVVGGVPAVFTIHNLAFQGVFPSATLPSIGLSWEMLHLDALEFWGQISYLKGGINFSEKITTVSPTYAKEIVKPDLGFGFDGILSRRAADLVGIVNGIDIDRWNPEADPFVEASFRPDDLRGKQEARRELLRAARLSADEPASGRPVIGMISRLTDQKGLDLIAAARDELMALDAIWVMLGSGESRYEEMWKALAARHPDRVAATIGFDERLAHLIEAGADIFLMPSRFEPCGLNQLYSLRYGTVPVVRATGGLDDTVRDVDEKTATGTGFKFTDYTPAAMLGALRRALKAYENRSLWRVLQETAMREDHSWDVSAREYVKVYRELLPES
jgi:starch synthase